MSLCLLCEAPRELCQPCTHSLFCSGARVREPVGGGSLGSREAEAGRGPRALMAHWVSSKGPVIYGCRSLSVWLACPFWTSGAHSRGSKVKKSLGGGAAALCPDTSIACIPMGSPERAELYLLGVEAGSHPGQAFSQLLRPVGFLVLRWTSFIFSFLFGTEV